MLSVRQSVAFREGAVTSFPTLFGMAAWGLVVGVAMVKTGLTIPQAIGMTLLVFAGSAQLASLPLILAQAPLWVIFVTALVVNLRFLIFSALVAPRFAHLPWRERVLLGFYTGDVTVALFLQRFPHHWNDHVEATHQVVFLKGLLVPNWFAWQLGSVLGIVLGSQVPTSWGLGFAGTVAILCVTLPMLQNLASVVGVSVAGIISLLVYNLPYKLGLLVAMLIGMSAAMLVDEWQERRRQWRLAEKGDQDE